LRAQRSNLVDSTVSRLRTRSSWENPSWPPGKTFALVCHSGVLRDVKTPDGKPLVQGKRLTGFTNTEEEAVGLANVVPFLVEDELKAKGGIFSKAADWQPYVLTDGLLITGQNPASSGPGAKALVDVISKKAR
jgi:putative intracellular protease/amidase